jgi:hypothetical protein
VIFLAAILVFAVAMRPARARLLLARLGAVGIFAAAITSYFWLPFLRDQKYLQASPYLQSWKYDSYGAQKILAWLLGGDLIDHGRLPVLTFLLALGVAAAAARRTKVATMAIVLFAVWLLLYFGRVTWGPIADLIPMHEGMLFDRFVGAFEFAAILLIGIGGEWLWERFSSLRDPWRVAAPAALVVALMIPALVERYRLYAVNTRALERTRDALAADSDLAAIVKELKSLPHARVYAGLRTGWGGNFRVGLLHVYDVLTFNDLDVLEPPYQAISHNADLVFHFDDRNSAQYGLFDVKYVVAPPGTSMASFLKPILTTRHFVLYQTSTSGYGQLATQVASGFAGSRGQLFAGNLAWFRRGDFASGRFIAWAYRLDTGPIGGMIYPSGAGTGTVSDDLIEPDLIRLRVDTPAPAPLIIKTTYFPKWHLTIDGIPTRSFMASPSFIGVEVPAGKHIVQAEYESGALKKILLFAGAIALLCAFAFRRRFPAFDAALRRRAAR